MSSWLINTLRTFAWHLLNYLKAQVLELGAGLGRLSLGLASMGAHVTSTEAACQRPGMDEEYEYPSEYYAIGRIYANTKIGCS